MLSNFDFLELYKIAVEVYEKRIESLCKRANLASQALSLLLFLATNPDHKTAKEICSRQNIKANLISFHINNLVKEGYLVSEKSAQDKRKCILSITSKAQPLIEESNKILEKYREEFFSNFSPSEVETYESCFNSLRANLLKMKKGLN